MDIVDGPSDLDIISVLNRFCDSVQFLRSEKGLKFEFNFRNKDDFIKRCERLLLNLSYVNVYSFNGIDIKNDFDLFFIFSENATLSISVKNQIVGDIYKIMRSLAYLLLFAKKGINENIFDDFLKKSSLGSTNYQDFNTIFRALSECYIFFMFIKVYFFRTLNQREERDIIQDLANSFVDKYYHTKTYENKIDDLIDSLLFKFDKEANSFNYDKFLNENDFKKIKDKLNNFDSYNDFIKDLYELKRISRINVYESDTNYANRLNEIQRERVNPLVALEDGVNHLDSITQQSGSGMIRKAISDLKYKHSF